MISTANGRERTAEFPVVGIGASAGGITALQSLFKAIPGRPHLAFVVVQHLLPDQPSHLASLFRNWTALRVREARDGMPLEPDCVYLACPGDALALEGGVLTTRPLDRAGVRPGIDSIDSFLESLAKDAGARAIAVILSGTGTDGAAGAVRVRQAGGMVLVQEPATAMHDAMPLAAIANGAADHVMPLGSLAQEIVASASPGYERSESARAWSDGVNAALGGIVAFIRERAGFDLTGYKTTPLLWRIQRRMAVRRVPLFLDYEALLQDDPAELEALIRGIPIHVTEFFRDPPAWEALRRDVIPRLFAEAKAGPLRAWTPACATGEEAYSLAMLLVEHGESAKSSVDFQLFATDAAADVVARAGRGVFKTAALDVLSAERRHRFFYAADGALRVRRSLREKMVFAPQDLLADPPLTNLDLVTCRNLMIYLEPETIERVVYLLHSALRMGGYLLVGKGESISPKQRGFEELASGTGIYRKTGAAPKVDVAFPKRPVRLRNALSGRSVVEAHAHLTAAEQQELAAAVVDENFQVLRLHGDTTPFLRLRSGEPTLNLLALLVPPGASVALEGAAEEALTQRQAITIDGLPDRHGDLALSMRVTPLEATDRSDARLLVSFVSAKPDARGLAPGEPRPGDVADWSEALRVSHEELEASREELQALNEELRASNDQLNIANDELASANAELRGKVEELETQSHVLSSGQVATLFLDEELRVRWFTPAVRDLFPLTPADTGRRITDLVPRFDYPPFIPEVRCVMATGVPSEAEIRTFGGRWYVERILPFRTDNAGGASAGVAVTFHDISDIKHAEQAASEEFRSTKILQDLAVRLVSEESPQLIYEEILAAAIEITRAKAGTVQMLDGEAEGLVVLATRGFSRDTEQCFHRVDARSSTSCGLALRTGDRSYVDFDPASADPWVRKHVRDGVLSAQSSPLISRSGKAIGMVSTHWGASGRRPSERELRFLDLLARQAADFIERSQAAAALRQSEERYRNVLNAMAEGFALFAPDFTILDVNQETARLDGRTRDELIGRNHWAAFPGTEDSPLGELYRRVLKSRTAAQLDFRYLWPDGRDMWVDVRAYPMSDGNIAVFWRDTTDRRRAEEQLRDSEQKLRTLVECIDEGSVRRR